VIRLDEKRTQAAKSLSQRELNLLAYYNQQVHQGIQHSDAHKEKMFLLQERFNKFGWEHPVKKSLWERIFRWIMTI